MYENENKNSIAPLVAHEKLGKAEVVSPARITWSDFLMAV